jgi:predicted glycoside hydrolase/deacetylase ChbG (UPF0249 family)
MPDRVTSPTLAEKLATLSQPPEARLLILNGDDLGMCHAANAATFDAMERGLLTAASLMLPCPWAYAACSYARAHPQLDIGVHLTLTSEWQTYRWGPLLGAARCPSLVNDLGFFYRQPSDGLFERGEPEEIKAEAEAQIRRALDWGLDPTNLDGHMGTFYAHPHFLPVYVELARVYRLPLRMAPRRLNAARQAAEQNQQVTLDGLLMLDDIRNIALRNPLELKAHLLETLRTLQPGVTELVLHAALPTPEAKAIMHDWEARAEAHRLMTDDADVRRTIEEQGIVRIGWRMLRDAQRGQAASISAEH